MMLTRSLLRYGLAGLLALTGIAKLLDVPGFVQVLSTYQALPPWALRSVALACGLVELYLAEWLASGKRLPHAALNMRRKAMRRLLALYCVPNCRFS